MRPLIPILLLAATCVTASAQRFVKVFDNVAALLAANPNDTHTNAYVTGRTIANDGGGGIYTWHSSSTASTNSNLSILKANNFATGRWLRDNGFVLTALTTDRVAVIGSDSVLTNGTITLTELNTLTGITGNIQGQIDSIVSGSSNWVDEGDTNVTLPGIAKYWKGVVTNSLEIGQPGEAGLITLYSTNGTYAVTLTVAADGTLTAAYGTTNMLTVPVGSASGWGGAGLKYLTDGLGFVTPSSPIGTVTNVNVNPTDNFYAVRSNATVLKDGTLYQLSSARLVNTNAALVVSKALSSGNNVDTVWGVPVNEALVAIRVPGVNGDAAASPGIWLSRNTAANLTADYTFVDATPAGFTSTLTVGQKVSGNIISVLLNSSTTRPSIQWDINGTGSSIDTAGSGSPEGVVTAAVGSVYRRWDGGSTTTLYLKTSGSGNTGWSAVSGTTGAKTVALPLYRFPDSVDGTGCAYINTNDVTARTFMRPRFSAAGATNANFATFSCLVPSDLNTSVDLTATIKVSLVAGDTSASTYTVGMASVANSASSSPTAANYVTLTVPADGSGAAGDVEGVNGVTLNGWRSAMTAGQWLFIQLQRDGSDASATAEDLLALEITYTSTQ